MQLNNKDQLIHQLNKKVEELEKENLNLRLNHYNDEQQIQTLHQQYQSDLEEQYNIAHDLQETINNERTINNNLVDQIQMLQSINLNLQWQL